MDSRYICFLTISTEPSGLSTFRKYTATKTTTQFCTYLAVVNMSQNFVLMRGHTQNKFTDIRLVRNSYRLLKDRPWGYDLVSKISYSNNFIAFQILITTLTRGSSDRQKILILPQTGLTETAVPASRLVQAEKVRK